MGIFDLSFESEVSASPQKVWEWIISLKGISSEMWPYFRMTAPKGFESLENLNIILGQPLFRSKVFLFGFLPIDYSDITLIEIEKGSGFVEKSPMGSMKLWRHERRIISTASGCKIIDHLTFEPKMATQIIGWFIRTVFQHRHKVLRKNLNKIA
jgi:ligand-binding SRPBCC domain-containing protein